MGYGTRSGTIQTFEPDDTDTEFYLDCGMFGGGSYSLASLIQKAREKWGEDISLEDIEITPEYIHTDCLGYDRYDPTDYTNYLRISIPQERADFTKNR